MKTPMVAALPYGPYPPLVHPWRISLTSGLDDGRKECTNSLPRLHGQPAGILGADEEGGRNSVTFRPSRTKSVTSGTALGLSAFYGHLVRQSSFAVRCSASGSS